MSIDAACRDAHLFTEYNMDLYIEIKGQRPFFVSAVVRPTCPSVISVRPTVAGEHRQKSGLSFQILALKEKRFHGKGDFLLL
jgi:hypothetical protein